MPDDKDSADPTVSDAIVLASATAKAITQADAQTLQGRDRQLFHLPPLMGGDVKNIERRLVAPKPDAAALVATLAAVGTSVSTTVALATHGVSVGWIVLPLLI